ncbi:DUF4350 domain-containing protein [Lacinutrix sp. Bg11-31]|uniref:DUF4350 domain-containing protein n=1 Tax=Lacinutrix sp. Bg11-31 TaxID=2057808 RepID=UPI000C304B5C|nr:DUF4350 domain-containing protein [Lacinutrix sp. Bg11-31]AUC80927.1 hypothetical protein CW733_01775 [Lacinutrix sp. Bg11-31]
MDKRSKIALFSIGAIILFMIIAEIVKPKALSWRDSYNSQDKIPLGCYVLYNELETFSSNAIITNTKDFYSSSKSLDSTKKSTAIFINKNISFYGEEADAILNYVSRGNTALISTSSFYGKIADTLNIETENIYSSLIKKETEQDFTNPRLGDNKTTFKDVIENSYFTSIDTLKTTVLGTVYNEDFDKEEINFIKVEFGENNGAFFIHTNPFAFTNYHLLNNNENYAATVLSYLPKGQIIWDDYYKSGRRVIQSPLRYILSQSPLKWAFYLSLITLIIFVLFKSKRTQRIVPVIEPLKNTTVEFTKTIGGLYFQNNEYTNIIDKKITFFLENIRTQYYLNTTNLNSDFIEKLTLKSDKSPTEVKALIDLIKYCKQKIVHTENDLIVLNTKFEEFLNNED